MKTYAQAIAYAERERKNRSQSWHARCQQFARTAVGAEPWADSARLAANYCRDNFKLYTSYPPPAGAIAYFGTTVDGTDSGDGHAVLSAGGGMCYSNDVVRDGYIDLTPITNITKGRWSFKYRGWIDRTPSGYISVKNRPTGSGASNAERMDGDVSGRAPGTGNTPNNGQVDSDGNTYGATTTTTAPAPAPAWVKNAKPIVYNPPLVRSAMHGGEYGDFMGDAFRKSGKTIKDTSRLGRIIPDDFVPNTTWFKTNRYGFRFLYNPSSYTESIQYINDVNPAIVAQSLSNALFTNSSFTFTLYLNRIEDMQFEKNPSISGYPTSVSDADFKGIKTYGTMWDVEYLFRTMNGDPRNTWRGKTSEIGIMASIPMKFYLGAGRRLRGRIDGIGLNHIMFNKNMVPILTEVQVQCSRYVDNAKAVAAPGSGYDANPGETANAGSGVSGSADTSWAGPTGGGDLS